VGAQLAAILVRVLEPLQQAVLVAQLDGSGTQARRSKGASRLRRATANSAFSFFGLFPDILLCVVQ
jgi:hypothetical protein